MGYCLLKFFFIAPSRYFFPVFAGRNRFRRTTAPAQLLSSKHGYAKPNQNPLRHMLLWPNDSEAGTLRQLFAHAAPP